MQSSALLCHIFFAIFVTSPAFSSPGLLQMEKLKPALNTMRSLTVLPTLHGQSSTIAASSEFIPSDVVTIFERIQKFVFGRTDLLTLRACDGCQAVANANAMSVNIEAKYIESLRANFGSDFEKIIFFILAHEISHFSYEYIVLSSATGLSPNGHIPLLTKGFPDYLDLTQFIKMSPSDQQIEIAKYLKQSSLAHSEVDLLGLITLQEMGIDAAIEAKKFLASEVSRRSSEELAQTDFEVRLKNVNEAFPLPVAGTP